MTFKIQLGKPHLPEGRLLKLISRNKISVLRARSNPRGKVKKQSNIRTNELRTFEQTNSELETTEKLETTETLPLLIPQRLYWVQFAGSVGWIKACGNTYHEANNKPSYNPAPGNNKYTMNKIGDHITNEYA